MTRTISFTLNGEPVAAEIKSHHNLVELLQRDFNLMGARESCGQGMCGCCTVLVNVADIGRSINPKIVETQLSGGALMQLGFTMFEKMHVDGGQVTNASLADYKIPALRDVPLVMHNETVDTTQANGPYGAKGVGEVSTFCVSPAIANAIDDAVGVRLTELPLTPEAVFRALRANAGKPLEDDA